MSRFAALAGKGLDPAFFQQLATDNRRGIAEFSYATRQHLRSLRKDFDQYFADLAKIPNGLDVFAPCTTPDQVFAPGRPALSYGVIIDFLHYSIGSIRGRSGTSCALATAQTRLTAFFTYWTSQTGSPLASDVIKAVTKAVRSGFDGAIVYSSPWDKTWIGTDELEAIVGGYFSMRYLRFRFITRLRHLLFLATCTQTSVRPGSFWPKIEDDDPNKRGVRWSDATVHIKHHLPENEVSVGWIIPDSNAKNQSSVNVLITMQTNKVGYLNAVAILMRIAQIEGALPKGFTDYTQMLDPALFDGQTSKEMSLHFADDAQDKYVFPQQGDANKYWSVGQMITSLHDACRHAGLDKRITPYSMRRGGGIAMRVAGHSTESVSRHYRHRFASTTVESYVGQVVPLDVNATVFQLESKLQRIIRLHPDRPRAVPALAEPLTTAQRLDIFASEEYMAAYEAYRCACEDLCEEYDVQGIDQVDAVARRKALGPLARCCKQIYEAKRREIAIASSLISPDDQRAALDDFPAEGAPDDIDLDIDSLQRVLCEIDFASSEEALSSLLDNGDIDGDAYLQGSIALQLDDGVATSSQEWPDDIPIDPALFDESTTRSPANAIAGPSSAAYQSTANAIAGPSYIAPTTNLATAANAPDSPGAEDEAVEADVYIRADNVALVRLRDAMLNDQLDQQELWKALCSVPEDERDAFAYRPGEFPIDDKCPFCAKDIALCIADYAKLKACPKDDLVSFKRRHIQLCAASAAESQQRPALQLKYEALPDPLPEFVLLSGPKPETGRKGGKTTRWSWSHRLMDQLKRSPRKCWTCPDHPAFETWSTAREHLLLKHDFWLPLATLKPDVPLDHTNDGFDARYYLHDRRYLCDPKEICRVAHALYDTTFAPAALADTPRYGRMDLVQPDGSTIPDDEPDHDVKYMLVLGKAATILQDGFCILCVHNPRLGIMERMKPWQTDSGFYRHSAACVKEHLREAKFHQDLGISETYIWDGGFLRCPDAVCERNAEKWADSLGFVQHLVSVHGLLFPGKTVGKKVGAAGSVQSRSFTTQTEVDKWRGPIEVSKRRAAVVKSQANARSGAKKKRGTKKQSGASAKQGKTTRGKGAGKGKADESGSESEAESGDTEDEEEVAEEDSDSNSELQVQASDSRNAVSSSTRAGPSARLDSADDTGDPSSEFPAAVQAPAMCARALGKRKAPDQVSGRAKRHR